MSALITWWTLDIRELVPGAHSDAVTATGAIVCRVAAGRIVEQWDIDDRLSVMQQLALAPTPEHAAT